MNKVILLTTVFKPGTKTVYYSMGYHCLTYGLSIWIDCSLRETIQQASVDCRINILLPAYCDFLLWFCCDFHSTTGILVKNWMERFVATWQVSGKKSIFKGWTNRIGDLPFLNFSIKVFLISENGSRCDLTYRGSDIPRKFVLLIQKF